MAQAFLEGEALGKAVTQKKAGFRPGLLALIPYLLLIGTAFSVFAVTEDDPYITFRYAANLLAGHGPVFNVGEHVEADTSPLHMLLCAVLLKVAPGTDILFKAKLFSLGMALLALWEMRPLGRQLRLTETQIRWAQVLVALNVNFALAAVNALETTLYAALALVTLTLFLRECRASRGGASGALLFVAWLARPEAILLFPALLAVRLLWARRLGDPLVSVLPWAAAFLLPAAALTAGRWAYYGQVLPNTYYAKHVALGVGLRGGLRYLLHPLSAGAGGLYHPVTPYDRWTLLLAPLFWGLAAAGAVRLGRSLSGLTLLAAVAAAVVFVLRAGGDWMQGWRFLVSSLPLLAFLQVRGVVLGARWAARRSRPRARRWAPALLAVFWGGCFLAAPHDSWAGVHFTTDGPALLAQGGNPLAPLWVQTSQVVREHFAPGSTIAYSEMGYACWDNLDKRFLDLRGLTDAEIAHLPQAYKTRWGFTDYRWYLPGDPLGAVLQRRRPDAIIIIDEYAGPDVIWGMYRRVDYPGLSGRASLHGARSLAFVRRLGDLNRQP